MPKPGPRTTSRYSEQFKATAVRRGFRAWRSLNGACTPNCAGKANGSVRSATPTAGSGRSA